MMGMVQVLEVVVVISIVASASSTTTMMMTTMMDDHYHYYTTTTRPIVSLLFCLSLLYQVYCYHYYWINVLCTIATIVFREILRMYYNTITSHNECVSRTINQ
jgi:hypothetical protein